MKPLIKAEKLESLDFVKFQSIINELSFSSTKNVNCSNIAHLSGGLLTRQDQVLRRSLTARLNKLIHCLKFGKISSNNKQMCVA